MTHERSSLRFHALLDELGTLPYERLGQWRTKATRALRNNLGNDHELVRDLEGLVIPKIPASASGMIRKSAADRWRERARELIEAASDLTSDPLPGGLGLIRPDRRSVFLVQGRDLVVPRELSYFLRALKLDVVTWENAVTATGSASPYIGDVVAAGLEMAQAVTVIMGPDDAARLRKELLLPADPTEDRRLTYQPRPNVLFEAGMALGMYPNRTLLVQTDRLRGFSDIAGRHVVKLNNSTATRQAIAQRLTTAGCDVKLDGDWLTAGNLDARAL